MAGGCQPAAGDIAVIGNTSSTPGRHATRPAAEVTELRSPRHAATRHAATGLAWAGRATHSAQAAASLTGRPVPPGHGQPATGHPARSVQAAHRAAAAATGWLAGALILGAVQPEADGTLGGAAVEVIDGSGYRRSEELPCLGESPCVCRCLRSSSLGLSLVQGRSCLIVGRVIIGLSVLSVRDGRQHSRPERDIGHHEPTELPQDPGRTGTAAPAYRAGARGAPPDAYLDAILIMIENVGAQVDPRRVHKRGERRGRPIRASASNFGTQDEFYLSKHFNSSKNCGSTLALVSSSLCGRRRFGIPSMARRPAARH